MTVTERFSTTLDVAVGDFATDPRKLDGLSVSELVRHWALTIGERIAFITPDSRISWASYDATTDRIASALAAVGEDSAVALYLPDTMVFHAALCAAYRTGRIAVGIGSRSGVKEVAHLSTRAGCRTLVTTRSLRGQDTAALVAELRERTGGPEHVIYVDDLGSVEVEDAAGERVEVTDRRFDATSPRFGVDDVSLLNSTSGTTGLPKLVTQTERRWIGFSEVAVRAGRITGDDVFFGAVPAPFGFGLWTSHFLPALLGAPNVVVERFNADVMVDLLERERVTILNCVSTQFKMLLRSERAQAADLGALRAMFTGGEAVPYSEALAFEERTGAAVLQFYGSNETGAVSVTTVDDDADTRLRTCGRVVEEARVRVFDDAGTEVLGAERRGQPGVNGPLTCHGYWDDDAANAELYTDDGWMLLGDIVEIDAAGRLRVVGRKADIIIRGGKNISAVEVEEFVRAHPAVTMVAVVGVHDALFGEKVCAVVVTADGTELTADDLSSWLAAQGVTREYTPEHVVTVDELPLAPGGKVAKGVVKVLAEQQLSR
ncbi:AMP-binding protein [Rhodococcus hoagii]|uniref:AMP-binding enzyme n=1 Tax=Prescottella equi ATCC 33707 TaxID=525370 RepID=E9SZI9_RHOHA|nr:class I adenylate-forming enzyme family protein [Prescottella equi]EGD24946.1 AMP-binding enzyme [Prescottella equi ATCC 33707]MBM4472499.1 AMP-binding protein [Prescottella equi]MBM4599738.1 AMP-binding protein [Prescottella equi]